MILGKHLIKAESLEHLNAVFIYGFDEFLGLWSLFRCATTLAVSAWPTLAANDH